MVAGLLTQAVVEAYNRTCHLSAESIDKLRKQPLQPGLLDAYQKMVSNYWNVLVNSIYLFAGHYSSLRLPACAVHEVHALARVHEMT